jgi:hypothetical protein
MIPYLKNMSFDPETLQVVTDAFDNAILSLRGWKQPEIVQEVLAQRIIALVAKGERDMDVLCSRALQGLGARGAR